MVYKLGLFATIDENDNLIIYGRAPRPTAPESKVKGLVSSGGEIVINQDRNLELFEHVREKMQTDGLFVALDVELKTKAKRQSKNNP